MTFVNASFVLATGVHAATDALRTQLESTHHDQRVATEIDKYIVTTPKQFFCVPSFIHLFC